MIDLLLSLTPSLESSRSHKLKEEPLKSEESADL